MSKQVVRVDESGGEHAMWSPSSASRWLKCPLSVIQSLAIPQAEASDAAKEGTLAHRYGEQVLLDDKSLDDIEDETMRAGVEVYTEYVQSVYDKYEDPGFEIEGKVVLEQLIPGGSPSYWSCFGSADFFIYDEQDEIMPEVIDFKYGRHAVEVKDNKQLMLYALGTAEDISWKGPVKLTIVQPRAHHADGPVRSWVVKHKELQALKVEARKVLANAHRSKKVAGDHCHFCPLASTCEAKHQEVCTTAAVEFAKVEFEPPIPDAMDDERIALIVKHHKEIIKWVESVVLHAAKRVKGGKKLKGTKLIRNPGRNGWNDDAAFRRMCKDLGLSKTDAYKLSPKGIGDIKKLLKEMYENDPDELLADYTSKSEGSISLVSDDDPRVEYNSAALEFAGK